MKPEIRLTAAAVVLALLAGCASEYIISTNSGVMIPAKGQPRLDQKTGIYTYKDDQGRSATIKKEEVAQIMQR